MCQALSLETQGWESAQSGLSVTFELLVFHVGAARVTLQSNFLAST
jgi:hypothetical protein